MLGKSGRDEGDRLKRFLEAVCRHPWARFDFLRLEGGLTEFEARCARRLALGLGYVEVLRIATNGQPQPPRRYSLTPAGAHTAGLPLPPIHRRAEALVAAPHLERVRSTFLSAPAIRERLLWSISPWRGAPGLLLDGLACMRGAAGREALVALAVPPEGAVPSWWYVELMRSWSRLQQADPNRWPATLALLGAPFAPTRLSLLAAPRREGRRKARQRGVIAPVFLLPPGACALQLDRSESWIRLPGSSAGAYCPWDEPSLITSGQAVVGYLGGRIPRSPGRGRLTEWMQRSRHSVAAATRAALSMTHGDVALLQALVRYPAFTAVELGLLLGRRKRSLLRGLERMEAMGLAERLPVFQEQGRFALTRGGLEVLAYRSMQSPARLRAHRAWPVDHGSLTRNPRHMEYILAFMFALRRQGMLARWDLVHAHYAYRVAATPGDLRRPRWVELVPDSSGVLKVDGRDIPFWLEIDRGTRTGVRLTRQLEKYILARFGYAASDVIPMLLYVAAEGGETRARAVARRLVALAARYRLRRMPAMLITTWELLTEDGRRIEPDPMKEVWRLPFRWREFIPPIPPAGGEVGLESARGGKLQTANIAMEHERPYTER